MPSPTLMATDRAMSDAIAKKGKREKGEGDVPASLAMRAISVLSSAMSSIASGWEGAQAMTQSDTVPPRVASGAP